MDTDKHTISYASFVTKVYCWFIFYLERKGVFKYFLLLTVVLLCIFTRYVVLSFDKIMVKQIKTTPANFKNAKAPLTSAAIIFKGGLSEMKQKYQHKIKPLEVRKQKAADYKFMPLIEVKQNETDHYLFGWHME